MVSIDYEHLKPEPNQIMVMGTVENRRAKFSTDGPKIRKATIKDILLLDRGLCFDRRSVLQSFESNT
jgi:hypothetical protein